MIYLKDLIEQEVYQLLMEQAAKEEAEHLVVNNKRTCPSMDANRNAHVRMVLDLVPPSIYYRFINICRKRILSKIY